MRGADVGGRRGWRRRARGRSDGAFRDVGAWMASKTQSTVGRAKATVETAGRLAELPETARGVAGGCALGGAGGGDRGGGERGSAAPRSALLECAAAQRGQGVEGRVRRGSRPRRRRIRRSGTRGSRANRYLRHRRISDVEGLIEMRGPIDATAAVMAALEPREKELFEQARASGRREEPEALAFDAAVEMADDSAAARLVERPSRAPATLVVRVDHSAFVRATPCRARCARSPGSGRSRSSSPSKLSGDAIFKALIHDGTDVLAVSHLGRTIPARLRTAVFELFSECAIEGCHVTGTSRSITTPRSVSRVRPHSWNLSLLCRFHHDHKHRYNQRVVGEGTNRRLVPTGRPPPGPPAPNNDAATTASGSRIRPLAGRTRHPTTGNRVRVASRRATRLALGYSRQLGRARRGAGGSRAPWWRRSLLVPRRSRGAGSRPARSARSDLGAAGRGLRQGQHRSLRRERRPSTAVDRRCRGESSAGGADRRGGRVVRLDRGVRARRWVDRLAGRLAERGPHDAAGRHPAARGARVAGHRRRSGDQRPRQRRRARGAARGLRRRCGLRRSHALARRSDRRHRRGP